MALKVTIYKQATGKYKHLVTFSMDAGKLVADWQEGTEWFKDDLERNGIVTADGLFTPKDGHKFLDNLPIAFSSSSKIMVEEV
jgi:hypothetical protein